MKPCKTLMILLFFSAGFSLPVALSQPCPSVNPVVVTSPGNTAGQQNLQWAIGCINTVPALTRITFNINGAGPHIIQPGAATSIPVITKNNTWIDGTTDNIIIDGANSGSAIALDMNASGVTVEGLYIRNYDSGSAIQLRFGANHLVNNNRLSGNQTGLTTLGNVVNFTATNNIIGLDSNGNAQGNSGTGISVQGSVTSGAVVDNTIANNLVGLNIAGAGNVLITDNSFYCNTNGGIVRSAGPAVPQITSATPTTVAGTSTGNATIQVFKHNTSGCSAATPCQGKTHIGNATANAAGNWTLSPAAGTLLGGERVTATATIGGVNTSAFNTACVQVNCSSLAVSAVPVHVSCLGQNTGAIVLNISGGTAPFNISWSGAASGAATTSNTPYTISGLGAGNYTIVVTEANGCTATQAATINQPSAVLAVNGITSNVRCFGESTGSINITVSGGSGNYTYDWADLTGVNNPEDRTGLAAGVYSVTVSDAAGCTANNSFTIGQPLAAISASAGTTDVACFGVNTGAINLTVSGGTTPYTFAWADLPGANDPEDRNNLPAGVYTVTITDAGLCTFTNSYTINGPTAPLSINETISQISCFGQTNGAILITTSGGTPGYSFDWADLPGLNNPEDRSGLPAGIYAITVTDANGCQMSESYSVQQPSAALDAAVALMQVSCAGGSNGAIALSVSGGTSPYNFDWADLPGANNVEDRSNLSAGIYEVTITDVNSCSFTTGALITQPQPIDINAAITSPPCMGGNTGAINLTVGGGTPPYTFDWADLPGNNNPEDRTGLGAATYSVTVTDAANCQLSDDIALSSPGGLVVNFTQENLLCFGADNGSIDLMVNGGQPPYTIDWLDVAGADNPEDRTGLVAGLYHATVSDANGCLFILDPGVSITQPDSLMLTLSASDETGAGANDGIISAAVSGGTPPYTYAWSNNGSGQSIQNLPPGNYSLTVTDANDCAIEGSATVQSFLCNDFGVNISGVNIGCFGDPTGSAIAQVINGTAPIDYLWNTNAVTATIGGLIAGVYHVLATDAAGCQARDTIVIEQAAALSLQITTSPESLAGANDGSANANAGGGTPPYSYAWSVPNQQGPSLSGLGAGTYTCTVTDAQLCTIVASGTVAISGGGLCQPAPAYALYSPEEVCGNTPFTLRADDLYPGPEISYVWLLPNGDTLRTTAPELELTAGSTAFAGQYFVLRDSMGCLSDPVGGAPIAILSLDPGQVMAGPDTVLCALAPISLFATLPPEGLGRWQSLGEAMMSDPLAPNSSVSNLQPGANIFLWKVSIGDCPQAAIDTLVVFFESQPQLQDDRYRIERVHDIAVMHVLLNDHLEGLKDTTVTIVSGPTPDIGELEWLPDTRQFRYSADENFRGAVQFQYQVCNEAAICGTACATATVTIEVLNLPVVPEGVIHGSGDDNERLFIKGINGFSSIELAITDRWGDVVFHTKNYSNEAPWKGENQRTGAPLPQGAYYYILKAFDGENLVGRPQTGVIHLLVR